MRTYFLNVPNKVKPSIKTKPGFHLEREQEDIQHGVFTSIKAIRTYSSV